MCWNNKADFQLVQVGGDAAFWKGGEWSIGYVTDVYSDNGTVYAFKLEDGNTLYLGDKYDEILWLAQNPFRSRAQEDYMWIHHPGIAKKWADKYGSYEHPKRHSRR